MSQSLSPTDVALSAWRTRSNALHEARQQATHRSPSRWRRVAVFGAGLVLVGMGLATLGQTRSAATVQPSLEAVQAAAPTAAVSAQPAQAVATSDPAAAANPAVAPPAAPTPGAPVAIAAPTPQTTTLVQWTDAEFHWILIDLDGPVDAELRWTDAQGTEAIERWPCANLIDATTQRCIAGRKLTRFDTAMAQGASPGLWNIEVCATGTASCTPVGQVEITG